jgi:hypothetical protein
MQYNAEWLFLDYYSPMDCPGNGCTWVNTSEAQIHMNYVADVIKQIQPDIINICEVEGCDELNTLIKIMDEVGGVGMGGSGAGDATYTPYLKKGTDTSTGQNVGMLTRYQPLTNLMRTETKLAYPQPGSVCGYTGPGGNVGVSKHYYTTYNWYGRNVLFVGIHLLAYPTDSTRCAEREAQAQIIQNLIVEYMEKDYEILVMGDFNDFDGEVLDANGNKPLSHALGIMKGLNGMYAGKYELKNVAEKMAQSERWTDWWDSNKNCVSSPNEFSMIDHILMTPFLISKIKNVGVYHGYSEFCGKYDSDHYPVFVDMENPYL